MSTNNTTVKTRDEYVDVAKGLCMLFVVCIHAEVFGVLGMSFTFIAVPMFFFLSGFYDRSERPFSSWLVKSARTLLLPGVIWLAIGLAYVAALSYAHKGSYTFTNTVYDPFVGNGAVWFLFALFYAKVILGALLRLKLPKWCVLAICVGGGYLGMAQQMPLCLDEGLAALPLYCLGKFSYPYIKQVFGRILLCLIGTAAIVLFLMHFLEYTIVPVANGCFSPNYIFAFVSIVLSFIPVLRICKIIDSWTWLANFGRHSLGIMLTHMMMCHTAAVVLKRVFVEGSTPWIISFLAAYVVICFTAYWLTILIERYCPILLGKK